MGSLLNLGCLLRSHLIIRCRTILVTYKGTLISPTMRFVLKYNCIQVDNTCYKDLQTLASGYKVEYVLYVFISPAIFFYLFYLFLSFFALF